MTATVLPIAIAIVASSWIASGRATAEKRPAAARSARLHIVKPPELESAAPDTAIIRWTAQTSGGTVKHYGIVRYGTDPKHLDQTAMSANKCTEKKPPYRTYRVRIEGLAPKTTYYYTVDTAQADGIGIGLKSPVNKFTTPPVP